MTHILHHPEFGGCTDVKCNINVFWKKGTDQPQLHSGYIPRGTLSALIDQGQMGRYCRAPNDGRIDVIGEFGSAPLLEDLLDTRFLGATYRVPCFRLPSGWCQRKLTQKERMKILDCNTDVLDAMGQPDHWESLFLRVPLKIRRSVLRSIRYASCNRSDSSKVTDSLKRLRAADVSVSQSKRKKLETNKPPCAKQNLLHTAAPQHNLKAARADDAEIPLWIWNDRIEPLLNGRSVARKLWEGALETLRQKFALRRWIRNVVRSYLIWRQEIHDRIVKETCDEAARDAIRRATKATWWEWDDGSRFFFWRWPKLYVIQARDGVKPWFKDKPRTWRKRQRVPTDPSKLALMQKKVMKVRKRGYVAPGKVLSLMNMFDVPKGEDDIRMVYDGTKSGLNDVLWAPWFPLPTVETSLRGIGNKTWMGDNDIAEQFHNFVLHKDLQALCGIDLTELFNEECNGTNKLLWERWTRAPMGIKLSPYQAAQGMIWWEEMVRGDRDDPANIFRWDHIDLNLPGKLDYKPNDPWVSKRRCDNTIACDFSPYVDDIRTTGDTQENCWQATRRVGSMSSFAGVQDAARKRREVSQRPGAWAGSITRTTAEAVMVTISQERWEKAQGHLNWLRNLLQGDNILIPHKKLESMRGFLVYVTRTYPASVPYLKGIHLTLDGWRPNRDEDGWATHRTVLAHFAGNSEDVLHEDDQASPPEFVKPVPRLADDVEALCLLFAGSNPLERIVRPSKTAVALYGFGDASGSGFGFTLLKQGNLMYRHGQWSQDIASESSNHRELLNLVVAIEELAEQGKLGDCELFVFTDNTTAEAAFYKGTSKSKSLFSLVLRLRKLQMERSLHLHIIHVAGTRMIAQGTDGLSRGDLDQGVFGAADMLHFVPLHLGALERSNDLEAWIRSWYPFRDIITTRPEDWYDGMSSESMDHMLWTPPPAAADVATERQNHGCLERPRLWHELSGKCQKCRKTVKGDSGLFCMNFSFTRGPWMSCRGCWCDGCYADEGQVVFPVAEYADEDGEIPEVDAEEEKRFMFGRRGDHLMTPFQCDLCHFRNIQKRDPRMDCGRDGFLLTVIRKPTLDSLWSREPGTVYGNLGEAKRMVKGADRMGLHSLPPITHPAPVEDKFGMAVAALFLERTLNAGRNRATVQFSTARKIRSVYTNYIQASLGYEDGAIMAKDDKKLHTTTSVTYGRWFERFVKGCHNRMGDQPKLDKALDIDIVLALLTHWEKTYQKHNEDKNHMGQLNVARVATFVLAGFLGGLRGEEILLMDLGVLRQKLQGGLDSNPAHVILPLFGRFKGEDGTRWFSIPVSAKTKSGIEIGKWIKRVIESYESFQIVSGWVFRSKHEGNRGKISEYDPDFHEGLQHVQMSSPGRFKAEEDVADQYSLRRSLRRGSTTHARNCGIPEENIEYNNRWRKQHRAKGKAPALSMVQHYTDMKGALPYILRYSREM